MAPRAWGTMGTGQAALLSTRSMLHAAARGSRRPSQQVLVQQSSIQAVLVWHPTVSVRAPCWIQRQSSVSVHQGPKGTARFRVFNF